MYRFVTLLNARRVMRDASTSGSGSLTSSSAAEKAWHGVKLDQPDWGDFAQHRVHRRRSREHLVSLILNAYREPLEFELPPARWRSASMALLDRHVPRNSPHDIEREDAPAVAGHRYRAESRSVVVSCRSRRQRRHMSGPHRDSRGGAKRQAHARPLGFASAVHPPASAPRGPPCRPVISHSGTFAADFRNARAARDARKPELAAATRSVGEAVHSGGDGKPT